MSNYTIRKLEPDEFHLLIPLMKDCFGMDVNVEYFEWKFLKNPAGFVAGFIAVSEQGQVSAFYDVIPQEYVFNGERIMIFQACDGMTHSNHRRKGLFQKIVTFCYEYLASESNLFLIGFGGEKSTPGLIKIGWTRIFDIRYYFYPKVFTAFRNKAEIPNIFEISNYSEIEQLVRKSNASAAIHSYKSLDVFNWRLSNPLHQYQVIAHKANSAAVEYTSYLCYYILDDKIMLFDFYFHDLPGGRAITGFLKNLLAKSNYKGIISFCKEDSDYATILKKLGFISNPFRKGPLSERTPFICYTKNDEMLKWKAAEKWLINSFDHDAM